MHFCYFQGTFLFIYFFIFSVVGCGTLNFYGVFSRKCFGKGWNFGMTTLAFGLASQAQANDHTIGELIKEQSSKSWFSCSRHIVLIFEVSWICPIRFWSCGPDTIFSTHARTEKTKVFLVRDTSSPYNLATCEVSWILSIQSRIYKPDTNFQHCTTWILGKGANSKPK